MTNQELIHEAEKVIFPHKTDNGRFHGDVGAALISKKGKLFLGTCIDTPGWGFCAERSAIAAMITDREYIINKIVAVWKDEKSNKLYVLPPCGICREFMRQINPENLETDIILGKDKVKKLKDLIPFHEWPGQFEQN